MNSSSIHKSSFSFKNIISQSIAIKKYHPPPFFFFLSLLQMESQTFPLEKIIFGIIHKWISFFRDHPFNYIFSHKRDKSDSLGPSNSNYRIEFIYLFITKRLAAVVSWKKVLCTDSEFYDTPCLSFRQALWAHRFFFFLLFTLS